MRNPIATPPRDTSPARRPCVMLRDTRYIMFGPGVRTMPSDRAATPSSEAIEITTPFDRYAWPKQTANCRFADRANGPDQPFLRPEYVGIRTRLQWRHAQYGRRD